MDTTTAMAHENDINLKETELRLGLPGTIDESENAKNNKRVLPDSTKANSDAKETPQASKAQIVGWPPVRSFRKNNMQAKKPEVDSATYVKVSMDGAPYLRKIDLKVYNEYPQLLNALGDMFKLNFGKYSESEGYNGSEFVPAYEDKDGDLMLVGDVPFNMFISTCKRLRIMKGSEAKGLGFSV